MFTGLVEALGKVLSLKRGSAGGKLELELPFKELKVGESVAVNGVCLTVTAFKEKRASFDLSFETLKTTNLGLLKPGDRVNLERALKLGDRLGGHILLGHVDFTGRLLKKQKVGEHWLIEVSFPPEKRVYFVEKGSVGVDGISLTVRSVASNRFSVAVIPHTYEQTNLRYRKVGELLNVELDLFGKYAVNYLKERYR
ncbi:MAG: riboflavin synthase [Aquificae bacterium]|nr:riboflavin synthase [Aquificota bacterium]